MGGLAIKGDRIDGFDIAHTLMQFRRGITDKETGLLNSFGISEHDMRLLGSGAHPTKTSTHGDIDISILIEDQLKNKTFREFLSELEVILDENDIKYYSVVGFKQISIAFPIYKQMKKTSGIVQIDMMFSETKEHYDLMYMMKTTEEKFEKAALVKAILLTSLVKHSKVSLDIIHEVHQSLGDGDYRFFNVSDVGNGIKLSVKDYSNKDKPKKVKLGKEYIIRNRDKFIRKIFHMGDNTKNEQVAVGSICGISNYINQYKYKFDMESIKKYADEILLTRKVKFNWKGVGL